MSLPDEFDYYEVPDSGFHVFSWCPAPTPTVPPTQVHLHLPPIGGVQIVVRFKGPHTLDELIAALQHHRHDVWPKTPTADDPL